MKTSREYSAYNKELAKIRCLEPAVGFADWRVKNSDLYISIGLNFNNKTSKLNFMRKLNAEEHLISGGHLSREQFFEELPEEAREEFLWHMDLLG
jgi:hypothetical protein